VGYHETWDINPIEQIQWEFNQQNQELKQYHLSSHEWEVDRDIQPKYHPK
jgi:hypothetical protein